ncbi:MAG: hypothetical protein H0X34_06990 [Chthoniobacterales bacterium]|nr:hypothetical protein [Chthoniobacterales bacterium]
MTRPEAESAAALMNAKASKGRGYLASYAGKGWRVERWIDGKFDGIELTSDTEHGL